MKFLVEQCKAKIRPDRAENEKSLRPEHMTNMVNSDDVSDSDKDQNTTKLENQDLTPLHPAALKGHVYVQQQINDKQQSEANTYTPLHIAALQGHCNVVQCLLENGADIECKDNNSATPLHLAALNGHQDVVQCLLKNGADIQCKAKNSTTPLHMAAFHGHHTVVKYLLEEEADYTCRTTDGLTPLHIAKNKHYKQVEDCIIGHAAMAEFKQRSNRVNQKESSGKGRVNSGKRKTMQE